MGSGLGEEDDEGTASGSPATSAARRRGRWRAAGMAAPARDEEEAEARGAMAALVSCPDPVMDREGGEDGEVSDGVEEAVRHGGGVRAAASVVEHGSDGRRGIEPLPDPDGIERGGEKTWVVR